MIYVAMIAVAVLVGIALLSGDAAPQPLPQDPPPATQDCGCGVPASPRGPR